jgi:predicted extracellular nuclease
VTALSGIWQQHASLSVLALASCDGLDGAEGQDAAPPPSTEDVHQLLAGWAPGLGVSVRGIVVARWRSGSGAFGFALQDPAGAPASGVRVVRPRTSPVPASAPEVGDRVRVTARTSRTGEHLLEL